MNHVPRKHFLNIFYKKNSETFVPEFIENIQKLFPVLVMISASWIDDYMKIVFAMLHIQRVGWYSIKSVRLLPMKSPVVKLHYIYS